MFRLKKIKQKSTLILSLAFVILFLILMAKQASAATVNIQLSKTNPGVGESVTAVLYMDTQAARVELWYVPQSNPDFCEPSQFTEISTNIIPYYSGSSWVGSASFSVPSAGNYYLVPVLYDSNGALICAGNYTWDNSRSCPGVQKCINGYLSFSVSGYDMSQYWIIHPGNYWIFQGISRGNGEQSITSRFDVEAKTMANNNNELVGYPILITKNSIYGYYGPAVKSAIDEGSWWKYNHNIKIWFSQGSSPHCPSDKSPCYYWSLWKEYARSYPYYDTSNSYVPNWYEPNKSLPNNGLQAGAISGRYGQNINGYYFLSPMSINQFSNYRADDQSVKKGSSANDNTISEAGLCSAWQNASFGNSFKEGVSNLVANVTTSSYSGQTVVFKFNESNTDSPSMSEEWFMAKDIGPVRITQKFFMQGYNLNSVRYLCDDPNQICSCDFSAFYNNEPTVGYDSDCNFGRLTNRPVLEMNLSKYYLGAKLSVKLNVSNSSLTLNPGQSFSVDAVDPTTNYTYEGYLETSANFIAPNGQNVINGKFDKWFDQSGKVNITISSGLPLGTYTASFRPWIGRLEPANSSSEVITEQPNLPWSDPVVINVVAPVDTTPPSAPSGLSVN